MLIFTGSVSSLKGHTYDIHAYGCSIKFTLEIILCHMRSWWIMTGDNWSAKTYSIQFQAKETSNQSKCVASTLSNDDLSLTKWSFSASIHQTHSLALSLPHLTSPQLNATQLDQSLIHTLLYSLIHSHNFTHPRLFIDCSRISSLTPWLTRPLIPSLKKLLVHSIIHTFT